MAYDTLYKVSSGGAVVVRYLADDDSEEDNRALCDSETIESICVVFAKLIGKNKGLSFSEDAVVKLETIFEVARQQSDFGNGRYVRNILEQARMSQATRLVEEDFDSITTEDVLTIKAEDIAAPTAKPKEKRRIGFVV